MTDLIEVLRLCIGKSPAVLSEGLAAARAIQNQSPIAHKKTVKVIEGALSDPQAMLSDTERAILRGALAELISDATHSKTLEVRVRVTPAEKAAIQTAARAANLTVADYIRRAIGLQGGQ